MRRAAQTLFVLALLVGSGLPGAQLVLAVAPPPFISQPADGLTVGGAGASATLMWWASCGSEFTQPVPAVRALGTGLEVPRPVEPAIPQQVYVPGACNGHQSVGERIAIRGGRAYWVAANRMIESRTLAAAATSPPDRTWAMVSTPPLIGNGPRPGLVADDLALSWTETTSAGSAIYEHRSRIPGADDYGVGRTIAFDTSARLTSLTGGPNGLRFAISTVGSGSTMIGLTPRRAGGYTSQVLSLGNNVTAVAADQGAVYWASSFHGAYSIFTRTITTELTGAITFGSVRSLTSASGLNRSTRVTALIVDPAEAPSRQHDLWWSLNSAGPRPTEPSLMRLRRSTGSALPLLLNNDTSTIHDMATDGIYVFWTDSHAIYRVRSGGSLPHGVVDPVSVEDVSPDLAYLDGLTGDDYPFGADPGGRVSALVVDPRNDDVLLAATQYSGPWRSTDRGQTWQQSGTGMTTGLTGDGATVAMDPSDHNRALYATADYGLATDGTSTAGAWVSRSNGVSWLQVSRAQIPGSCAPVSVAFARGAGWVSTTCGLYTSTGLTTWTLLTGTVTGAPPAWAAIEGSGNALFACGGNTVYRSIDGGVTWLTRPVPASGSCQGARPIAVVPGGLTPGTAVIVRNVPGSMPFLFSASRLDMISGTATELGFPSVPQWSGGLSISGIIGVWTAKVASSGYVLFAANGDHFYQWAPGGTWNQFPGVHWDARALAFPGSFDPFLGDCRGFAASDGSVAANTTRAAPGEAGRCLTYEGPWRRAQHGLHAYKSYVVNGVHRDTCTPPGGGSAISPCPVLFVTSGDNGAWVRDSSRAPAWSTFHDCCGDSGGFVLDPAQPNRAIMTRNGSIMEYHAPGASFVPTSVNGWDIKPPDYVDPDWPSSPSGISMVMSTGGTLPNGDYVALRSVPDAPNATTGNDRIVRRRDGGGWTQIGPPVTFGLVKQVETSGGSFGLVVWLRIADGSILRGSVAADGTIAAWTTMTTAGMNVSLMWANPAKVNDIWVEDDAAHDIKQRVPNGSGGFTWRTATDLTAFAGGYDPRFGTSDTSFGRFTIPEAPLASLNHMWFPTSSSSPIRVATLGNQKDVAISHDDGATWIPLVDALLWGRWLAGPWSTWYDPAASGHGAQSDLYVALLGRGAMRVTAPFETLIDVAYEYCPTGSCGASAVGPASAGATGPTPTPSTVDIVDELTGHTIHLRAQPGGIWRGHELLNGAGIGTLRYHRVVDGVPGPRQTHAFTGNERSSGVSGVRVLGGGPDPFLASVGPLTISPTAAFAETCPGVPATTYVKTRISVPAGSPVYKATLDVTSETIDEVGDRHLVLRKQVPMTESDPGLWNGAVDVPALIIGPEAEAPPGGIAHQPRLIFQVTAEAKGGRSVGAPVPLRLQRCGPTGGTVPGKPTSVSAAPRNGAAVVSWKPPANDGGQEITGYRVTAYRGTTPVTAQLYGPTVGRGRVSGLKNGTAYTFTVAALNVFGAGPASDSTPEVVPRK